MRALRILLISSALPRDTTAGEVLLYRHFSRFPELYLVIATDNLESLLAEELLEIKANRFLNRLTITRFSTLANDICQCLDPFFNYNILRNYIKSHKLDLIVTVAEGIHWIAAQKMSQEFNIPLVTIFHDWWPDLAPIHFWAKETLDSRFKQLYQQSALALCVSEGMQELLGNHPNSQVLYPIPIQLTKVEQPITGSNEEHFKLVYAGSLSGIYAPMLQELCASIKEVQGLQLKLFGRQPHWLGNLVQQIKKQDFYGGFLTKDLLRRELPTATALLVTISFENQNRRWAQTSFPSKLVEYCQFQKPIIIWGPEYCSAVHWAHKHQSALVVTSPLAKDLVTVVKKLATQPQEQTRLKNKALEMAEGMFNPEKIQRQFIDSLARVADLKLKTPTARWIK
jgi:glycosyltransferase involved in cell wall biosynthesis